MGCRMVVVISRHENITFPTKVHLVKAEKAMAPTPVLLPGKSHGRRSLVGCSWWGHEELDTTAQLHFHFSLSCTGEGNGNRLQYSCLENPRDRGACWAAVYGAAQSQTWLTWLSSSRGAKIPHASWPKHQNIKNKKQYCKKFNKDF